MDYDLLTTKIIDDDNVNTYIIAMLTQKIIQDILESYRTAKIEDPNIMQNVVAQLQFIRINICNEYIENVENEINKKLTLLHNEKTKEQIDNIIASADEFITKDHEKLIEILNTISNIICSDLNSSEKVKVLNSFDNVQKVFSPIKYENKQSN